MDDLATAAASLATRDRRISRRATARIPILLNDPQFGKEFTTNLQSFSQHLDSIGRKLDEGDGHGRQAHQRPVGLRRRPPARRGRGPVGDPALARSRTGRRRGSRRNTTTPSRPGAPTPTPTPTPRRQAMKLLVTGGAGFIGSHLRTAAWRGATASSSSTTSTTSTTRPSSAPTSPPTWRTRATASSRATSATAALVFRLFAEERFDAVAPPGGARRRAALARAARPLRGGQLRGDAAPPRGRRRARQAAIRLRLFLVGLRHQLEAPVLRGGPDRAARSRPTPRPSAPASSTSSPRTTSTACRPSACASSRSTARGSGRRWRSPGSSACLESGRAHPLLRRRNARAATTPTSTTSSTASRRPSTARLRLRDRQPRRRASGHPDRARRGARGRDRADRPALDRQPDQPGDVPVTFAAVEKAERLLGFRPRVPLEEGLRRSVEWYRTSRRPSIGRRSTARERHEHLHGRNGIRRARHGGVPRRLRHERGLRRQGRGEDRRAPARAHPDLRAGPRRGRRPQRARGPPALHDRPEERRSRTRSRSSSPSAPRRRPTARRT